jgi:ATP-dependent DNA helicase RecG
MFEHMLIEGKRPPVIREVGESVCVNFQRQEVSAPFRAFVAEESNRGRLLTVDQLLVLQYLLEHVELDTPAAARLCQRDEATMRDALGRMETQLGYLERGGTGRGTYWTLRPHLHRQHAGPGHPERNRRIDWEAAKTRVLSVLKQKCKRGEQGLTNADIKTTDSLRPGTGEAADERAARGGRGTAGRQRPGRQLDLAYRRNMS